MIIILMLGGVNAGGGTSSSTTIEISAEDITAAIGDKIGSDQIIITNPVQYTNYIVSHSLNVDFSSIFFNVSLEPNNGTTTHQ